MRMIGMPKNFIGARPGRVYSWGGSASIQTASGTVVTFPQSEERAFSGLSIYGHSTQDGTPSPENPVPIVSAGDSGEINVTVSGKNLLNIGTVTFEKSKNFPVNILAGTYTFSAEVKSADTDSNHCLVMFRKNQQNIGTLSVNRVGRSSATITLNENANEILLYASAGFNESDGDTATFTDIQLEIGTVATAYEPYKTPQALTLSTPGGLPGVPVDSGGNYTDESGQQWVCDEIDLKRGKYVQRVGKGTLNSDNVPNQKVTTYDECDVLLYQISDMENFEGYRNLLCNKYGAFNGYWTDGLGKMSSNLGYVYFGVPKGESSISDGTEFVYPLETPIETDLPAEEIDAYKALHTYSPTTTVSNDANAWMKVEYKG